MSEPTSRLKLIVCLVAAALCVGVGYKLAPVQPAETKTVFVDKVIYKDRVVTKDVVRTETRPDGTKIVTEEKSKDVSRQQEHEVKKETVTVSADTAKYSLGLGLVLDPFNPLKREYQVELGRRLWETPIWATVSYQTNKTIVLGLRVHF